MCIFLYFHTDYYKYIYICVCIYISLSAHIYIWIDVELENRKVASYAIGEILHRMLQSSGTCNSKSTVISGDLYHGLGGVKDDVHLAAGRNKRCTDYRSLMTPVK